MKSIFETCAPREEVLHGELREQQFAASLTKVLRGAADAVYGDPLEFFANTYATSGLKSLLSEGLGRLTGSSPGSAAVIRLETSFGGGKTHNLIALYHLCHGSVDPETVKSCVVTRADPGAARWRKLPAWSAPTWMWPRALITATCGRSRCGANWLGSSVTTPADPREAAQPTRWSARATSSGRLPARRSWEKLIGDDPALLMIDEIAYYLRVARGARVSGRQDQCRRADRGVPDVAPEVCVREQADGAWSTRSPTRPTPSARNRTNCERSCRKPAAFRLAKSTC